ncbi:MAG: DNA replication and repair protein RecF [Armatimonadota bacterium]|nr:MAG: DNA replication and repair protein RecF [Armatimonadota bacterium]
MHIRRITILNFRNLEPTNLELTAGFWAVLGDNAQGKSNFLEACSVLCRGQSHRTERERELARRGDRWFTIEGRIWREQRGGVDLAVRLNPEGKKELLTNGSRASSLTKYAQEAASVHFSSDDVEVVRGEPSLRRDFLNEVASLVSQGYVYDYSRFRRALEQKSRALKDIRDRLAPLSSLDVWDHQLADYAGRVCARRERLVRELAPLVRDLYGHLSGGLEDLVLSYAPDVPAPPSLEGWPSAIASALAARRGEELERGIPLTGPQRDDVSITIGGMDARAFASRGQCRTAALALRLAQARLVREQTGEWPVLLMDDVFAELDERRRGLLMQAASEAEQTLAAAASESDLPGQDGVFAGRLRVSKGMLSFEG